MFDISKEQLEFLTEKRFTAEEMAQLFGVSNRPVPIALEKSPKSAQNMAKECSMSIKSA